MRNNIELIELIEDFHLLQGIRFLYENELFPKLQTSIPVEQLAQEFNLSIDRLDKLLLYLSIRTDIIIKEEDNYKLNLKYLDHRKGGFWIDQYIGAYGFSYEDLNQLLGKDANSKSLMNKKKHALAYEKLDGYGFPFLGQIINEMEVQSVLEFGCGTGGLLIELARQNQSFFGVGMDHNAEMCQRFTKRVQEAGLEDRLVVIQADAAKSKSIIPSQIAEQIELLVASSLINEFFDKHQNAQQAIEWLIKLREIFPARQLLIADYYGRLGSDYPASSEVLVHDWIQCLSGQGIPPPDQSGWEDLYQRAGCTLLDVMEPKKAKIPYFIHLVGW